MNNLERRVRDQRTLEALRKNFMGLSGKLGIIARVPGDPIRDHFALYESLTYSGTPDSWEVEAEENLPMADLEESIITIGHVFDGLSRGHHLEITVLKESNKIVAHYKGYKVYEELSGNLAGYAPFDDWERIIDILYKEAENRQKAKEKDSVSTENETQNIFLKKLRMRWGI